MTLELKKENDKGKTYVTDKCKILYRNKGTIAGENDTAPEELIYLITGTAKITIKEKVFEVEAPAEIFIPAKTYHSIEAITDISFVLFD